MNLTVIFSRKSPRKKRTRETKLKWPKTSTGKEITDSRPRIHRRPNGSNNEKFRSVGLNAVHLLQQIDISLQTALEASDQCPYDDYIGDYIGCDVDWLGDYVLSFTQSSYFNSHEHSMRCTKDGKTIPPQRGKYPKGSVCTNVRCSRDYYSPKSKVPGPPPNGPGGLIFAQNRTIGFASYHFMSPNPYINFEKSKEDPSFCKALAVE